MNGFQDPPADHYGRPFWMCKSGLCFNSQPQVTVHLNYLKSFMKAYPGRRKFGVVHLSDLCHRQLTLLSIADKEILKYLMNLKEENLLNETMFIMMGDHGARFGEIREKMQGKLEERLPMMSVTLPLWFKKQYPEMFRNFYKNSETICSHLDFHATFLHLASFPDKPPSWNQSHGSTLFKLLPKDRTCAQAGIPEAFCPCLVWQSFSVAHKHVQTGVKAAVDHINKKLSSDSDGKQLCKKLNLSKILRAEQRMPSREVQGLDKELECYYWVKFETYPGGGRYEARFKVNYVEEYYIYDSFSRINSYGDQPKCIALRKPHLRKFCICH